jgi:hypothetical protein
MDGYRVGFYDCADGDAEISAGFPELKERQHYGTCEERSKGMVCDIEND